MTALEQLLNILKQAQRISKKLDKDWTKTLDDLIFSVSRTNYAHTMEIEWNQFFRSHISPNFPFLQAHPNMKIIFGYREYNDTKPNVIYFESESEIVESSPFDPDKTDIKELIINLSQRSFSL